MNKRKLKKFNKLSDVTTDLKKSKGLSIPKTEEVAEEILVVEDSLSTIFKISNSSYDEIKEVHNTVNSIHDLLEDINDRALRKERDENTKVNLPKAPLGSPIIIPQNTQEDKNLNSSIVLSPNKSIIDDLFNFGTDLPSKETKPGKTPKVPKEETTLGKMKKNGVRGLKIGGALAAGMSIYEGVTDWNDVEEKIAKGRLTQEEGQSEKAGVVGKATGGFAGGMAGAAAGAAIGSVVPVVGTLVGGLVGGALGTAGGTDIGEKIGKEAFETFKDIKSFLGFSEKKQEEDSIENKLEEKSRDKTLLDSVKGVLFSSVKPEEDKKDNSSIFSTFSNFLPSMETVKEKVSETVTTARNKAADLADFVGLDKVAAFVRKSETGSAKGDYSKTGDIGDGAGITFGAYQFTEKSGSLHSFIERYGKLSGDLEADALLNKMSKGYLQGKDKEEAITYLKKIGSTEYGKQAQEEVFKKRYFTSGINIAEKYGIKDEGAAGQIIDHTNVAGPGGAERMLKKANGDYSFDSISEARIKDFKDIAAANPSKAKFLKGWINRVLAAEDLRDAGKPQNQLIPEEKAKQDSIDAFSHDVQVAENASIESKPTASNKIPLDIDNTTKENIAKQDIVVQQKQEAPIIINNQNDSAKETKNVINISGDTHIISPAQAQLLNS